MQKGLFYIAIVLLFSACGTYNMVNFEVLVPSEITIPKDVKTLAFVYRNTWTKADTADFNKKKLGDEEINAYANLIDICYEGFADVIVPSERFDTLVYHKMEQEIIEDRNSLKMLSWDTVNNICSKYGADILVVLESSRFYAEKDYRGNFGEQEIHNKIDWDFRISTYDPMYSKILDSKNYKDSLKFTTLAVPNDFSDNVKYELERVSYVIGQLYAKRTSPHWSGVKRRLYVSGNKVFSAGHYYFQEDKLKTAITVWQKLVDTGKSHLAARACLNVACAYEMMGDIKNAKKYASLSLFHYKECKRVDEEIKYANKIIKELQNRIIAEKILDEQIED